MQETQVWSLGQEDPLEEASATHSSILAWRIRWTEEPGRLQLMGSQRVRHDCATEHGCWCLIKGFPPWFLSLPFFVFSLKRLWELSREWVLCPCVALGYTGWAMEGPPGIPWVTLKNIWEAKRRRKSITLFPKEWSKCGCGLCFLVNQMLCFNVATFSRGAQAARGRQTSETLLHTVERDSPESWPLKSELAASPEGLHEEERLATCLTWSAAE